MKADGGDKAGEGEGEGESKVEKQSHDRKDEEEDKDDAQEDEEDPSNNNGWGGKPLKQMAGIDGVYIGVSDRADAHVYQGDDNFVDLKGI